jgi:hypothetical protein
MSPRIKGAPEHLALTPGVPLEPPPVEYMDETVRLVNDATARLEPGSKAELLWVLTEKGVRFAAVEKFGRHFSVTQWIGDDWGKPISVGVAGKWSFGGD